MGCKGNNHFFRLRIALRNAPLYLVCIVYSMGAPQILQPQEDPAASYARDPAKAIGMTLEELYRIYGVPQSVFSVRGIEEWQDDVIFSYGDRNYYVYRDRIWQLELQAAYGIAVGENRNVIPLLLEEEMITHRERYTLFTMQNLPWPVAIRFNTDAQGIIVAIFIYRSDF